MEMPCKSTNKWPDYGFTKKVTAGRNNFARRIVKEVQNGGSFLPYRFIPVKIWVYIVLKRF
jgi:hypothetical protein